MKRLILLSALLIFACSSDDSPSDDSNDGDVILCTKRTQQYETNNGEQITKTSEYNYAGTQLLSFTSTTSGFITNTGGQNRTTTYSNLYEDNLVTSMMVTIDTNNDGNINSSQIYEFEYDNLGRKTKQSVGGQDKYFYNYLNDGLTVQITNSEGLLHQIHTYNSNKNLIEIDDFDSNGLYEGAIIYTYDDKNMPFKNVTTWYPLSSLLYLGTNNSIFVQRYEGCVYPKDITYNDNDYPVSYIRTSSCTNTIYTNTLEYNN